MKKANWYFDFISPFSYLQLARFHDLPKDLSITFKPVVFSGLLKHWGHKGPAEITSKRRFVYRFFKWQAGRRGVPFTMPPEHPFDPLPPLRLAVLAGSDINAIRRIFHFIYGEGRNLNGKDAVNELGDALGIPNAYRGIKDPDVKKALRGNMDTALAEGVFGSPSFVVDGELFWGDDATEMLIDYLKNPAMFSESDMKRISDMPMGLRRKGF